MIFFLQLDLLLFWFLMHQTNHHLTHPTFEALNLASPIILYWTFTILFTQLLFELNNLLFKLLNLFQQSIVFIDQMINPLFLKLYFIKPYFLSFVYISASLVCKLQLILKSLQLIIQFIYSFFLMIYHVLLFLYFDIFSLCFLTL